MLHPPTLYFSLHQDFLLIYDTVSATAAGSFQGGQRVYRDQLEVHSRDFFKRWQ